MAIIWLYGYVKAIKPCGFMALLVSGMGVYGNTPGTAGGPGGRDRTLAIKSRKTVEKKHLFSWNHMQG